MTPQEEQAMQLKIQRWGIYISVASLVLGAITLYFNTRPKSIIAK